MTLDVSITHPGRRGLLKKAVLGWFVHHEEQREGYGQTLWVKDKHSWAPWYKWGVRNINRHIKRREARESRRARREARSMTIEREGRTVHVIENV